MYIDLSILKFKFYKKLCFFLFNVFLTYTKIVCIIREKNVESQEFEIFLETFIEQSKNIISVELCNVERFSGDGNYKTKMDSFINVVLLINFSKTPVSVILLSSILFSTVR